MNFHPEIYTAYPILMIEDGPIYRPARSTDSAAGALLLAMAAWFLMAPTGYANAPRLPRMHHPGEGHLHFPMATAHRKMHAGIGAGLTIVTD
ncbi:hypothetical protein [Herbaspirillum sp.]|uniref:hypothetical protein n=1 Tax=Herbaspirillum sp. TaxID=1890675 RepID=UPI001B08C970|nr:hypothetical protein [Herbaspirillum sp.]MBO9538084.1 hypothetical protein [Herbaspirillum sp.]